MKIYSKTILFIVFSFLLLILAGCTADKSKEETPSPTSLATAEPTEEAATIEPSATPEPSTEPEATETPEPAESDDNTSTPAPTVKATAKPTAKATVKPTAKPTEKPTAKPTASPKPTKPPVTVENKSVEIKNFAFGPDSVTIKAGASITFTNHDSVAHTATASDGSFDTGLIDQDKSVTIIFSKAGTFEYFCQPHPDMIGMIIVE